ncbi:MAG: hypothetical protein H7318_20130 [Oligoflexus sp.]|nr:hypothetical protein [Oligoflexus sp.]
MSRFSFILCLAWLSLASAACESKLYTTGNAGDMRFRPSIDPIDAIYASPGDVLSIKGKNLSSKVSLSINDEITPLTITDSENASLTLPEGGDSDLYRLNFKIQDQTLQSFSLAKATALGNLPVIPVGLEYICDNLIFKDQSGGIVRGGAKCGSLAMAPCSSDGEIDCRANPSYKAASTADAARKIMSGESLAGVSGTAPLKPADCIADGEGGCVVDGLSFKAAKLSLYAAADIRSSVRIGGVLGSLANCSTDGEIGCRVVGPSFSAASLSGASAKILTGQSIGGIGGSAALVPSPCAVDNATNCVASSAFPAVVKANVTAGLIKAGTIIAGVNGAYPSPP